uniref:Apolipoprotein F n=1 Tax=Sinocyclocheilus rhinocerous TaxID=307959 RepID=A0A673MCR3_9TELE
MTKRNSKLRWLLLIHLLMSDVVFGRAPLPQSNPRPSVTSMPQTEQVESQVVEDDLAAAHQLVSNLSASLQGQLDLQSNVSCAELSNGGWSGKGFSQELLGLAMVPVLVSAGCLFEAQALVMQLYVVLGQNDTHEFLQDILELIKRGKERDSAHMSWIQNCKVGSVRWRRNGIPQHHCVNEKEERVYTVVEWIPAVSTLYNLGTAVYYASVSCYDTAKERAIFSTVDLGTDALMAVTGGTAGVAGYALGAGLKTGVKAGIKYLQQCNSHDLCQLRHTDTLFSFKSKRKQRKKCIRVTQPTQNSIHCLRPADILQNGTRVMRRRRLNKVIIFFLLRTKSILVASYNCG